MLEPSRVTAVDQIRIQWAGEQDGIAAFELGGDDGLRADPGELQFSAENSHRNQRAAAHEDNFHVQSVLRKDAGIASQPDRQEMGRVSDGETDPSRLLSPERLDDRADQNQHGQLS
jgi:hypothetical protein